MATALVFGFIASLLIIYCQSVITRINLAQIKMKANTDLFFMASFLKPNGQLQLQKTMVLLVVDKKRQDSVSCPA
jgi:hypothetical protein